jgi:hypothetical protein
LAKIAIVSVYLVGKGFQAQLTDFKDILSRVNIHSRRTLKLTPVAHCGGVEDEKIGAPVPGAGSQSFP